MLYSREEIEERMSELEDELCEFQQRVEWIENELYSLEEALATSIEDEEECYRFDRELMDDLE